MLLFRSSIFYSTIGSLKYQKLYYFLIASIRATCLNVINFDFAAGNGRCIAFDTCECTSGWSGPSCSIHDCNAVNQCSNKGQCVGPNVCQCFGGYQGIDCGILLDCSHLNNCSGNGICVFNNDVTGDTNICR